MTINRIASCKISTQNMHISVIEPLFLFLFLGEVHLPLQYKTDSTKFFCIVQYRLKPVYMYNYYISVLNDAFVISFQVLNLDYLSKVMMQHKHK